MKIDYGDHYKRSEKNIKRNYKQQNTLDMIKNHIKICNNFEELTKNPISIMYGFEKLKYELNGYYSFNLCKNKGTIRLIISINEATNQVFLEYISTNHYSDFKEIIRR